MDMNDNKKYRINGLERELLDLSVEDDILAFFSPAEAMRNKILPWRIEGNGRVNTLHLFTSDVNVFRREQEILAKSKGKANRLEYTFVAENNLVDAIKYYYNIEEGIANNVNTIAIVEDEPEETVVGEMDSLEDANSPTVIMVNSIISSAIEKKASDIHFEPERNGMIIRFRIDGALIVQENFRISEKNKASVLSRIKIMAKLDLTKKRDAQDGQITLNINNNNVDFRVNIIPCINGEKCVLRILDKNNLLVSLDSMGFLPNDVLVFQRAITKPTGVVLITGPTGSGKTTTLYAFLSEINTPDVNITTVENPVEYHLDGINQIQVNEKHVSFRDALRAILRQDPDVIMIGEVRDSETAENMVQAAQTGHLVFSTLHTNDSLSVLSRLKRLSIEEDAISQTVSVVIAQRLVRKICPHCKTEYTPNFEKLGLSAQNIRYLKKEHPRFYHGKGCDKCDGTGYLGRTVAYEYFEMDDALKEMIEAGKSVYEMKKYLLGIGMKTIWHYALDLVKRDISTIEEIKHSVMDSREEF